MTSRKCFVLLLLSFGLLSAAFNVSDYFYAEESNPAVAYTNFTLGGSAFSMVKIDGVETFLLENDSPILEQSRTDAVLHSYYKQTYYPSDAEIQELKGLLARFNASRNDGYDFKGKEEYICRNDVLMSNGKITVSGQPVGCWDNSTCSKNALLLFSVYGEGLNLGSASTILPPLMEFTPYSVAMDGILANATSKLDHLDESNLIETIQYIRNAAPTLKNYSLKIESTIFRTPRLNDSADRKACQLKCWAICPSFDLDQEAADQLKSKADAINSKVAPLANYLDMSTRIHANTVARLERDRMDDLTIAYLADFSPVNASGAASIAMAEDALKHVRNTTLTSRVDRLKSLHATIPEDIVSKNFSNLDSDISQYKSLTAEVRNISISITEVYNATRNAKNIAKSLVFVLETRDLDPVSLKSLAIIKNQTEDVDAAFRDGLTVSELLAIQENYTAVTENAKELLKAGNDMPATRVMLLFRGLARKVNTGIARAAEETEVMPKQDIPRGASLGAFSAIVFLSFASLAFLAFLYIFSTFNFSIPRTTHILAAAFVCLLVLLFGFSSFMYLLLGKTSTDATLQEFINDFNARNSSAIVVDLRGASLSDAAAMQSCASSLGDTLRMKNRSWSMYTITATSCAGLTSANASSALTPDECMGKADSAESSFVLGYSGDYEDPRFSIIYQNRADIRANLDYYESCPITALIS